MADKEDFELLKPQISEIPDEKAKKTGIPVSAMSQESGVVK